MGAPVGNQNAAKSSPFRDAMVREVKYRDMKAGDGETLRKIAAVIVDMAEGGDRAACLDVRDTLDGKPRQAVDATLSNPDGSGLFAKAVLEVVAVDNKPA